jgi:hypothetical protein
MELCQTGTKGRDLVSYGGHENLEAENNRSPDTNSGHGMTGIANRFEHSASIVRVSVAKSIGIITYSWDSPNDFSSNKLFYLISFVGKTKAVIFKMLIFFGLSGGYNTKGL